jgi:hypothetical protein
VAKVFLWDRSFDTLNSVKKQKPAEKGENSIKSRSVGIWENSY